MHKRFETEVTIFRVILQSTVVDICTVFHLDLASSLLLKIIFYHKVLFKNIA